jgi:hypothetical protein
MVNVQAGSPIIKRRMNPLVFLLTCVLGYVAIFVLFVVLSFWIFLLWFIVIFATIPIYIKAVRSTSPTAYVFAYVFTSSFMGGPITNVIAALVLGRHGLL